LISPTKKSKSLFPREEVDKISKFKRGKTSAMTPLSKKSSKKSLNTKKEDEIVEKVEEKENDGKEKKGSCCFSWVF